ncbi:MAG: HEAT repeat domain-containing protein [Candidatus Heimdallarchaeota archaeon]|nr:HEAT repeat domain-containing protein [Candidatus Heimdallarchaeota archaeon]
MSEDKLKIQLTRDEVKKYLRDLKDGDINSRAVAAYMLGTSGKLDKKIKQSLMRALKDKDWEVRKWAALSLGEIGERDSLLVPILASILKRDDSKEFRSHAAIILGELEKKSIPAIPALSDAIRDENTRVREWACWALNKIAGEASCLKPTYPEERPKLSERIRFTEKEIKK